MRERKVEAPPSGFENVRQIEVVHPLDPRPRAWVPFRVERTDVHNHAISRLSLSCLDPTMEPFLARPAAPMVIQFCSCCPGQPSESAIVAGEVVIVHAALTRRPGLA